MWLWWIMLGVVMAEQNVSGGGVRGDWQWWWWWLCTVGSAGGGGVAGNGGGGSGVGDSFRVEVALVTTLWLEQERD